MKEGRLLNSSLPRLCLCALFTYLLVVLMHYFEDMVVSIVSSKYVSFLLGVYAIRINAIIFRSMHLRARYFIIEINLHCKLSSDRILDKFAVLWDGGFSHVPVRFTTVDHMLRR